MNQSNSTTRVLTFQRKDGRCYSCSRNSKDLPWWGSQADPQLNAWAKQVGDIGAARGATLIDDHSIITELPPRKIKVRDHTVVVTVKRNIPGGRILTVSRSDEELKGSALEGMTARGWADENWSPTAAQSQGYVVLSRTEFYAEYEVEEE